jgi:protein-L-isoaspartate(D-aspartate) O-methyltransferase
VTVGLEQANRRKATDAVGVATFILSLRTRGIGDTEILRAMELVPREIFAPRRFADLSRRDVALPLACGQTMTAPSTVATMLVPLGIEKGHCVLEVGTGTGYVTALVARLGGQVRSLERFATLAGAAVEHIKIAGLSEAVTVEVGDGLAAPDKARYDRILVNGTASAIPAVLVERLEPGGRLVGAVLAEGGPRLVQIDRMADGQTCETVGPSLRLSPLLNGRSAAL